MGDGGGDAPTRFEAVRADAADAWLDAVRRCARCGATYTERRSLGAWQCRRHLAPPATHGHPGVVARRLFVGQRPCCGRTARTAALSAAQLDAHYEAPQYAGCVRCDHTTYDIDDDAAAAAANSSSSSSNAAAQQPPLVAIERLPAALLGVAASAASPAGTAAAKSAPSVVGVVRSRAVLVRLRRKEAASSAKLATTTAVAAGGGGNNNNDEPTRDELLRQADDALRAAHTAHRRADEHAFERDGNVYHREMTDPVGIFAPYSVVARGARPPAALFFGE